MNGEGALALAESGLFLLLTLVGPMLIASLVIGVAIGLVQSLTQIQEMTLTFVPKLIVLGLVFIVSLPFMGAALGRFMAEVTSIIVTGG